MNLRYGPLERFAKKVYRQFFPIPKSPYTVGEVEDICAVNLVPPAALDEFFDRAITLLQKEKGDDIGDYLEFGVFNGTSLMSMQRSCTKHGVKLTRFIGFDSFEGLPAGATAEDDGVWSKGMYSCSFDDLQGCLRRGGVAPEDVTFVKGWYNETLNQETRERLQLQNISIIFIDCDTYSSSKAVLDFIEPLLNQPLILCFDDWKLNDLDVKGMGEYKSFNEFLDQHPGLQLEEIKSYNRKSRSFLVKIQ